MAYRKWKWRKMDADHWSYVPSLTDRNPFVVYVEELLAAADTVRLPRTYRARVVRVDLEAFNIGPWRERRDRALQDARRFIGGHTSYDRLLDLYEDLVAKHSHEDGFVIPVRRHQKREYFSAESMMALSGVLPASLGVDGRPRFE